MACIKPENPGTHTFRYVQHRPLLRSPLCVCGAKSWLTLSDPMDCSPPGSSVQGISQARRPEWVAIHVSRGSSQPRNWTRVFHRQVGSLPLSHILFSCHDSQNVIVSRLPVESWWLMIGSYCFWKVHACFLKIKNVDSWRAIWILPRVKGLFCHKRFYLWLMNISRFVHKFLRKC